ncbi:hypothetical protein B0T24DRAFT_266052 [Lasiosphaeria ovina]|uniref:Uncharacterized protein n=1 Tax=Lasiosphaeria ovina TaxID=92902 RepID=A0AAE0N8M5_9PEZI|nr:hypothetical protein B0T24DRAFT_266052 [Lasiosphaeria ovina]
MNLAPLEPMFLFERNKEPRRYIRPNLRRFSFVIAAAVSFAGRVMAQCAFRMLATVRGRKRESLERRSALSQVQLSNTIFKAMALLPEKSATTLHAPIHNDHYVEPFYGICLCLSFREQLSLYVDGGVCFINQPSGLRTASVEDSDDKFCTMVSKDRQLWNMHGRKL